MHLEKENRRLILFYKKDSYTKQLLGLSNLIYHFLTPPYAFILILFNYFHTYESTIQKEIKVQIKVFCISFSRWWNGRYCLARGNHFVLSYCRMLLAGEFGLLVAREMGVTYVCLSCFLAECCKSLAKFVRNKRWRMKKK